MRVKKAYLDQVRKASDAVNMLLADQEQIPCVGALGGLKTCSVRWPSAGDGKVPVKYCPSCLAFWHSNALYGIVAGISDTWEVEE